MISVLATPQFSLISVYVIMGWYYLEESLD